MSDTIYAYWLFPFPPTQGYVSHPFKIDKDSAMFLFSKSSNSHSATSARTAIENYPWLDPFEPSRWCRGGWLQTLSIKSLSPNLDIDTVDECVAFDVPTDQTPPDVMSGFYFPVSSPTYRPVVILLHGMGGHARSGYLRSMAERLVQANYPVILWNHRGAGSSAGDCNRFHHPGYTEDLGRLVDYLRTERSDWIDNGLAAAAFSLARMFF